MVAVGYMTMFAQQRAPLPTLELRLLWFVLAGVVLLGAVVIITVDRWRRRPTRHQSTASDQLSEFRSLYERGELSREEFERIRSRLGKQLRRELEVPPGAEARSQASKPSAAPGPAAESPKTRPDGDNPPGGADS